MTRVDIRVPLGAPSPETASFIRECEDWGFHGVGIHDHARSGRDAYITLALAAQQTSRIKLYPATSNPVTRDATQLASLVNNLGELAPGRAELTLSTGFLTVRGAGKQRANYRDVRETILTIKELLAGHEIPAADHHTLRMRSQADPTPKIYVFASGPRLMEVAGEVADGAGMMVGLHPNAIAAAREHLEIGARRSGRSLEDFEDFYILPTSMHARPSTGMWPQKYLANGDVPWLDSPTKLTRHWLRLSEIDLPDEMKPEEVSDKLANQILDNVGLFGPPEYCAERLLQAREESGVDRIFMTIAHDEANIYDLPRYEAELFAERMRDVLDTGPTTTAPPM